MDNTKIYNKKSNSLLISVSWDSTKKVNSVNWDNSDKQGTLLIFHHHKYSYHEMMI